MAGVAGTNIDVGGYIIDPSLDQFKQDYKQIGANPYMTDGMRHIDGGYRSVLIPTASVLTLNSVPIQLVPAPGAGKLIIPSLVIATMIYNTTTYSTNASGATLNWGTAGAGTAAGFTLTQAFLQSSSGTNTIILRGSTTAVLPAQTDVNVPLTLIASTSDPTTGNSDLYVRVYFIVVTNPFANPSAA